MELWDEDDDSSCRTVADSQTIVDYNEWLADLRERISALERKEAEGVRQKGRPKSTGC